MPIHHIRTEADREKLIEIIKALKDRHWIVKVTQFQVRRTIPQNSLLHMWLACVADNTGNTLQDTKFAYKVKFLPMKKVAIFDTIVERPTGTSELDKAQMAKFLEAIYTDASQEGIILLRPDDLHWDSFYEKYKDFIG